MKSRLFIFAFSLFALSSCADRQDAPASDVENRVDSLLSLMTLQEKIGQMNQLSAWGEVETYADLIRDGKVGSLLNVTDPEMVNEIQRIAVEESRMHIPVLMSRDVIHGYKTIFPIPLGQAATFNPEIVEQGARIAAIEAASDGIRWTFAPMIDISRDARWGRMAESCGEDPCLTSIIGSAMIRGFQGDADNDSTSMAACAKHFAGYGASESGRDYNSTCISERELRNVYLVPFKAAVEAGAMSFMTSFNDNDGVPSTGNPFLLKQMLRDEWGSDAMVVTDWNSAGEMVSHGFVADAKEAAQVAVNAGVDMDMMSHTFIDNLETLVKEGKVKESDIDNAVRNILRLKFRLGLFDNPYVSVPQSVKYAPEHLAAARQAAEQSAILLKNDADVLPFDVKKVRTVALIGPLADAPYEQMGTWTFDGEKDHTVTPLAAIRNQFGSDVRVIYEPALAFSRDKSIAGITKAVAAARAADAVVVCVGEEAILSGEAHSLANLELQGAQKQLVKSLAALGKPLVTVVMAGRPLCIADEVEASDAVLYMFHPGTMGGPALADILFGKAAPTGHTPVCFPRMSGQNPIYYAHRPTGRPALGNETLLDSIPVEAGQTSLGCTSFFLDAGFGPLFPFGYGLTYTTFSYDNLHLSDDTLSPDSTLTASVDITNTGNREGTELVQLYVRDKVGSVTRPVKELKSFRRVCLRPGEKATVTFELPVSNLAYYNRDMKYGVEPGDFTVWIAPDSDGGLSADFKVQ